MTCRGCYSNDVAGNLLKEILSLLPHAPKTLDSKVNEYVGPLLRKLDRFGRL